jgi:hypothetical protein
MFFTVFLIRFGEYLDSTTLWATELSSALLCQYFYVFVPQKPFQPSINGPKMAEQMIKTHVNPAADI